MKGIRKIVLAYSGGLDTSVIISWLKENYAGSEVIAFCADVGQGQELEGLEARALASGASGFVLRDLRDEYVDNYLIPTLKAGADYEGYLLGTATARPCIGKALAQYALQIGADAVSHGCTGKGNDQVRFELAVRCFAPDMTIIAPWRQWTIRSREEAMDYAQARGIPLNTTRQESYSKDGNLWHLSHEGLDLEDPANEPRYEAEGFLGMCRPPSAAPEAGEYLSLGFDRGIPVSLNGEPLPAREIILRLNRIGGAHGVGLLDLVENRLIGMKCRGVYETPGGSILYAAHRLLESLCLDRMTSHKKRELAIAFADLVYDGQWFSPLREALSAFVDKTQERVTGTVRLKLYKGGIIPAGVSSPYSLYSEEVATFGASDYRHSDAEGFLALYGLSTRIRAQLNRRLAEGSEA